MTEQTATQKYDHACINCFTEQGPCLGECAIGSESTDKLTQLTVAVAKLIDGALALPADADREQAAMNLAAGVMTAAASVLPNEYTFSRLVGIPAIPQPSSDDDLDSALAALDIPEDIATKVIDREVSFEADNDCGDACKI